ncbi:MAG: 50S ribosomal protein L15 [Planctomycetota bacterium]|nr:50S ribosomal protein L15 [Planctomycetota bacterium]
MRIVDVNRRVRKHKRRKRLGMGDSSGHGKTAGRGDKGFQSRSGSGGYSSYEGGKTPYALHIPKRGFKNPCRKEYAVVNLEHLSRYFSPNEEVTPEVLASRGVIKKSKDGIKVLGDGELNFPLVVKAHKFSKSAREGIERAGGVAVEITTESVKRSQERE